MDIITQTLTTEKYALSRPLKVGEDEIAELNLPFSKLRGRDIADAQVEFETMKGGMLGVYETSKDFQALLIARLAELPYDSVMNDLAVHDFNALTLAMYRFLLEGV